MLKLSPNCVPDPRIGIGLCYWALDNKVKAKAAWQRSLEVVSVYYVHCVINTQEFRQNPDGWPAQLLLGLEAINASKDETRPDDERAREFISGTRLVQRAFQANQKSSAAANALCETFLQKGNNSRVRLAQ